LAQIILLFASILILVATFSSTFICACEKESEQNLVKRKGNEITWLSFQLEESRKEGGKIMVVCGW
jgi:hypothetical protein